MATAPVAVYQVFVDRFARGGATPEPRPARADEEGLVWRDWQLGPEEPPAGRDLYGGDLDGVAAHLDHIAGLGCDAVYLTPVFRAPSNHKYDTADYDVVDEHFGGDAAFDRLVAACRARGLALILDGVFNHTSERHPWVAGDPARYTGAAWRGYGHLRELDLDHAGVREALFGDEGVIARWTRRGADGWRLDCANDLGLDGCALAARTARRAGARLGAIGEVMAYPAGWTGPDGEGLDGVMNYWLRSAALALARASAPAAQIQAALDRLAAEMPAGALRRSWNVLASHDTPRLATVLADGARAPEEARARVAQALVLQVAYPGVPLVYYGEEIGLSGGADPANRAAMPWERTRWDERRLDEVRRLLALRRAHPALAHGEYVSLAQPGTPLVAFARVTARPDETVLFVANATAAPLAAHLFCPLPALLDALPLADLLDEAAAPVIMSQGSCTLDLPAHGVRLLRPREGAGGYRFHKPGRALPGR
jgi:alpha-glucosidase